MSALPSDVRQHREAVHPRYMHCTTCFAHWRIEPLTPTVGRSTVKFCPSCGTETVTSTNRQQDYWYYLAEGFGLRATERGVALIKGLYDIWNPTEFSHFATFVEKSLKGDID